MEECVAWQKSRARKKLPSNQRQPFKEILVSILLLIMYHCCFQSSASTTNLYRCSHHKNGMGRMYVANDPKSLCPACSHVFEPKFDSCESRVHPQVREIMSRELLLSLCLTSSKFRMLGFLKTKSLIWEWMR
ncbi:hypothetical protein Gotur_028125 [Gossypium turneri]